jgi:hypothetical protein
MSVFLSQANLSILVEPLSKISITMEELRSLSRGHLEHRIKKYVCSKSMREQLWESLHPDGQYPTTPRKEEPAAAASPGHLDPMAQLKHFAANNAIASFGTRSKQSEPQQEMKNSANTQAVKTMLNLPQPRSSASTVASPPSTKKPTTSEEALIDGKEVRALLWISGTQRSNIKIIRETVSYYGSVLDCGYLPRSKDAVYVKFSAYNKELQQTKHISTGPGRHSESFTVVDLTLYNHGHIDDGSVPTVPESLLSEARSSTDRHSNRPLRSTGGSVTGSPHHGAQPNASFGRRSVGDDSNTEKSNSFAGRRGTTDSYDNDDEDDDIEDDRPRRGGKRESNIGGRRGGASGGRRGGRGGGGQEDDSWDHYASNTICKYYRTGACKRGDTCKFAHPPQ